ncbi:tyrosine-type recombinase/integrase [Brevundimonas diminuta]|jgi:integrase|uniref:tyrosine-type recombinase/integrase n=1 Tax=Brevundimonas diminuta TaxID=293 RepID=UPI0030F522E2
MGATRLTDRSVAALKLTEEHRLELWDAELKGLYLRVSKYSKVWGFRYRRPDGSQPRVRLGRYVPPDQALGNSSALTVSGARAKARRLQTEVDAGRDPATEIQAIKAEAKAQPLRTFADMAEGYFQATESGEYRPSKKRKRAPTILAERNLYKKHLRQIAPLRIEAVTKDVVRKRLREILHEGKGVTSNRARSLIGQIFAWGITEDRVIKNPAQQLDDLAEEIPRTRVFNDAELRSLWIALEDTTGYRRPLPNGRDEALMVSRPIRIAIQLAALLLQRRAEIAEMRVAELDFTERTWTIPAERTKAGRTTVVPLGEFSMFLIEEALALRPIPAEDQPPSPFVFVGRGEIPGAIHPSAISHAMRDIRAAIGIPDITVHDLRRSGATRLARARVSPFILSKLLNHANELGGGSSITMSVYVQHDYLDEKREAIECLERVILATVRPATELPTAPPPALPAPSRLLFHDPV